MLKNSIKAVALTGVCILLLVACEENVDNSETENVNSIIESLPQITETITTEVQEEIPDTDVSQGDGGGNEFKNESKNESMDAEITEIRILVDEDEYFYDNAPVELEEIVNIIQEIKGDVTVFITDNDATYKTYNKLIEELEAMEIDYSVD